MAVAVSTFGTTLSDLQRLTNEDRALDYQYATNQAQINAQRMANILKARSEQQQIQAQRDANLARIIESRNTRTQQGTQFDAEMQNRLDLGRLDATSRERVATIGAGARGADPRFAETISRIQAVNAENQQRTSYATKLSATRKALVAQKNAPMAAGEDSFGWNNPAYKKRVDDLDAAIKQLDVQAAGLELGLSADGGYTVPDFTPIPIPAMLNPNLTGGGGGTVTPAAFAPELFKSQGGFYLDPTNPASPVTPSTDPFGGYVPPARTASLPVVAPVSAYHHVAPAAPDYTYKVDLNGNFIAVPNPALGAMQLGPSFLSNPTGYAP